MLGLNRYGLLISGLGLPLLALGLLCPAAAQGQVEVSRVDLASSFLRFETALRKATLDDDEARRANRDFDMATISFFQRKFGDAIKKIDALTASLRIESGGGDLEKVAVSLRVRVIPPVHTLGDGRAPVIRIESLYPVDGDSQTLEFSAVVVSANGKRNHRFPFTATVGGGAMVDLTLTIENEKWKEGRYRAGIALDNNDFLPSTNWSVVPKSLDTVRAENAARLEKISANTPELEQALASCRARNALLSDSPAVENTAQMLFDPLELTAAIDKEIKALAKGANPYRGRQDDFWRVLKVGEKDIPIRIYYPKSAAKAASPPLVIAFHGAGGDENMFMDAYGAGIIKDLAEEHGFLLVSPLTYAFNADMGNSFDTLLETLAREYPFDGDRVYVLGHSMGGGATAKLVGERPGRVTAAACICGFRGFSDDVASVPPTLVVAAELDPIANPKGIEAGAKKSIDRDLAVEYKLLKNYGHTLTVGKVLPETIEWLLAHE